MRFVPQHILRGLEPDHIVDVSAAVYDSASATLVGGVIVWIGAKPQPPRNTQAPAAVVTDLTVGAASACALPVAIFGNGFE